MAIPNLPCPMCGGPINWAHTSNCYQCLICDYCLPTNCAPDDDHIIIPGGNQSSNDFLKEFSDILDDGAGGSFIAEDENDPIYIEQAEEEAAPPVYSGTAKAVYKEKQIPNTKREVPMARGRNKNACRLCGTDKTVRGGPLKRLYGPNKDVCLKCFYENKEELENLDPEEIAEVPEPAYQRPLPPFPQSTTGMPAYPKPRPSGSLAEDLVLFNQTGEFVGRFNDVHDLAAAAAKTGAGAQVYRLMRVEVTIRIDIEGQQVF